MRKMILQFGSALALGLLAVNVMAAVSAEKPTSSAPRSRRSVPRRPAMPTARFRRGPAVFRNAGAVDSKGFLADPFGKESRCSMTTAATVDQYKDKLSDGQVAMFKRYPETYKIPVYPSHRTAALPPEVYEAAKRSALNVTPTNDGNGPANFTGNRYYAFPIPKNGSR